MQFKLFVNEQQKDGFKLSFDAKDKAELEICQKLAEEVIKKISKIEVTVKRDREEDGEEDYD